jgi:uncharacterized protein YbjT (DUF2867 family)
MKNKKQITVFGGTGFIGRYVIDRLCDQGYTIRVATRSPSSAYFLRTSGAVGQVVPVACNIFNDASIAEAIAGSSHIINLVGILAEKGRQTFESVHQYFPASLARLAARNHIERFVQVSSLGAGENASSQYAQSKAAGEKAVLAAFPQAAILRPSIVFGPEDGFFNRFARMAQIMPMLPLIGGGHTKFQPVYVGDVADAIVRSISAPDVVTGTFELGGDDIYSFKELMEKMFTYTAQPRTLVTVPFALAKAKGAVLQYLPGQLLTVDQVRSLSTDNVISGKYPGLRDFSINPTPLDAILPTYLTRYRPGGRFSKSRAA